MCGVEIKCLSVTVGDSVYGPGAQAHALSEFLKNPIGEAVIKLFDDHSGSGSITIKVEDEKIVLMLSLHGLGFYLQPHP